MADVAARAADKKVVQQPVDTYAQRLTQGKADTEYSLSACPSAQLSPQLNRVGTGNCRIRVPVAL